MPSDQYDNEHDQAEMDRFESNVPDDASDGGTLVADEPGTYTDNDEGVTETAGMYASEEAMDAATEGNDVTYSMKGVSSADGDDVSISPHENADEITYNGPMGSEDQAASEYSEEAEREAWEANIPDETSQSDEYIADEEASEEEIAEHAPSDEGIGNPAGAYASDDVLTAATPDRGDLKEEGSSDDEVTYTQTGSDLTEVEGLGGVEDGGETDLSEYNRGTRLVDVDEVGGSGDAGEADVSEYDQGTALEEVEGLGSEEYSADMGDTHPNIRDAEGRFLGSKSDIELSRDDEGNIVGYNPNTDTERVVARADDIADDQPRTQFGPLEAQTGESGGSYETEQLTFGDFGAREEGQRGLEDYEVRLGGGMAGSTRDAEELQDSLEDAREEREQRQERMQELADQDDGTLASGFAPQDGEPGSDYTETSTDEPTVSPVIPEEALAVSESGQAGVYVSRDDQTVFIQDEEGHVGQYDVSDGGRQQWQVGDDVVEVDAEGYEVKDADSGETIFGQTFDEYVDDEGGDAADGDWEPVPEEDPGEVPDYGPSGGSGSADDGSGQGTPDGDDSVWDDDSGDGRVPRVPDAGSGGSGDGYRPDGDEGDTIIDMEETDNSQYKFNSDNEVDYDLRFSGDVHTGDKIDKSEETAVEGDQYQGDVDQSETNIDKSEETTVEGDQYQGDVDQTEIGGDKVEGDQTTVEGDQYQGDVTEETTEIGGDKVEGDQTTIEGDKVEGDQVQGDKAGGDLTQGDRVEGDQYQGDVDRTEIGGDQVQGDRIEGDSIQGDQYQGDVTEIAGDQIEIGGDKIDVDGDKVEGDAYEAGGDLIMGDEGDSYEAGGDMIMGDEGDTYSFDNEGDVHITMGGGPGGGDDGSGGGRGGGDGGDGGDGGGRGGDDGGGGDGGTTPDPDPDSPGDDEGLMSFGEFQEYVPSEFQGVSSATYGAKRGLGLGNQAGDTRTGNRSGFDLVLGDILGDDDDVEYESSS